MKLNAFRSASAARRGCAAARVSPGAAPVSSAAVAVLSSAAARRSRARSDAGRGARIASSLTCGLAALAALASPADDVAPPTYTAVYAVAYKGRDVGSSQFSVRRDDERGVYTFRSQTEVKGMLRLVSPNPVIERSEFVVEDGDVRPLEFWYEDGSRKGEDNYHAVFDWSDGTALIDGEKRVELRIEPGVLDRGSMQVAVMVDMAAGESLGPYVLADEDSLKTYEYSHEGEQALDTSLGEIETVRYRQQRQGSSRSTTLWAAPALDYLPVRIEQHRDGKTETVFTILSWERL